MSLLNIKQHMMQVKIATLGSLCKRFSVTPDFMRCMLTHWLRKGTIRLCPKTPVCQQTCFKCNELATEIYEWSAE